MTTPNFMRTSEFASRAGKDYDNRPLVRTAHQRTRITVANRHGYHIITTHEYASSAVYRIADADAQGMTLIRSEAL